MAGTSRDEGYDELLDAIDAGEGYYLTCSAGHGSLPPQRVCSECGETDLQEEPLPDVGTIMTYTEIHVPSPEFTGETPVVAIADFGPVRLTGRLLGDADSISVGVAVSPTVDQSNSARHLAFDRRE